MLIDYKSGQTSIILRVKILNSSVTTGAGLTGLTNASTGLIISTIADNEASATAYTVAASHIQTIATLGTFAAPSASNCRFGEVDSTNHKGVYEIQIADARFAVSNAKSVLVSISGATNCAETDVVIPLRSVDPYDGVHFGMSALPNTSCTGNASLLTSGSGTDQLTVSGGIASSDVKKTLGTASAGVAGYVGVDWSHVNAPTTTLDLTNTTIKNLDGNTIQSGDAYARLGAPAGASVSADIAAVEAHAANIDTQVGTAGAGLTNLGDTRLAHLNRDISAILTTAMTESYAAVGVAPTLAQAIFLMMAWLTNCATSGTTYSAYNLGNTVAATGTLDSATNPSSNRRAT